MEQEKILTEGPYTNVDKFHDLFALLQSEKGDQQYQDAYEKTAELAKHFTQTKDKSSWNPPAFEADLKEKYPAISQDFIDALVRCVENYNAPVNLPSEPLW